MALLSEPGGTSTEVTQSYRDPAPRGRRCAMVLSHPGHELCAYGWAVEARPLTFIFTDGSGFEGVSRIGESRSLLRRIGAREGAVFGVASDRQVYDLVLRGEPAMFIDLVEEVAAALVADGVDVVVADSAEGYNIVHDLCSHVADAAVDLAHSLSGRRIDVFHLELMAFRLGEAADRSRLAAVDLGAQVFAAKLEAAHQYDGLNGEVASAMNEAPADYFRTEYFHAGDERPTVAARHPKRFYETAGEARLAKGDIAEVIRYAPHVRRICEAIDAHVAARKVRSPVEMLV